MNALPNFLNTRKKENKMNEKCVSLQYPEEEIIEWIDFPIDSLCSLKDLLDKAKQMKIPFEDIELNEVKVDLSDYQSGIDRDYYCKDTHEDDDDIKAKCGCGICFVIEKWQYSKKHINPNFKHELSVYNDLKKKYDDLVESLNKDILDYETDRTKKWK